MKFYHMAAKKSVTSNIKNKDTKKDKFTLSHSKNNEKIRLNIIPKIKYISFNEDGYYDCQLKVKDGKNITIINSIYDFVRDKNGGKAYNFNSRFIYNPQDYYFPKEDEEVFDFLEEYMEINKLITNEGNSLIKGKNMKVLKCSIRRLLELFINRNVEFTYEHVNSFSKVLGDKVPLDLYSEFNNGKILITHRKTKPIYLNKNKDVILYDGNIYLLSKEQGKVCNKIFNELNSNGRIIFKRENYIENLKIISMLSNKITFSNSMKNFIVEESKPIFNFNKNDEKIICHYKINSLENEVDFNEFKNDIFSGSLKIKKVEMFLEKLRFIKKGDEFLFIGDDRDIYNLLKTGLNSLKSFGDIDLSDSFKEIKLLKSENIDSNIYEEDGVLSLDYSIGDFTSNDIDLAIDASKRGEVFFKTSKSSYLDLQDDKVISFLGLVELLHDGGDVSKSIKIMKDKLLYTEGKIEKDNLNFIKGKEKIKLLNKNIVNDDKKQPKKLKGTLRNYQLKGFNWLNKLSNLELGAILADDMGLGKTIQTISFLLEKKYNKTLIITPTSLIYNWENEFKSFAPTLNIGLIHGSKEKRSNILNNIGNYDIVLTTYGTIKNDIQFYKTMEFDCIVIDEGQNIKNSKTQTARYVKSLKGNFKIALTGTPMENNLMELWSIFDFIMPGYLFTEKKFTEKFILKKENLDDLKLLISPFILRRMKRDVLKELPEKIEKKFFVEMTQGQNKVYKSYVKEIKERIKKEKDHITVLSYITKLRQLCLNPSLVLEDYVGGSGKIRVSVEILKENKDLGIKTLVFSQFTSFLKELKENLVKEGISVLYIDGNVKAKDRTELVKHFNESSESMVFLISLKAGGTGLNLTSASCVIHLDPWWNIAVENQATDRAYRIGQKNSVEVVKLITKNSIEEKIVILQEEKKDLINNVIDEKFISENNITSINSIDLLKLLEE